MSEIDPTSVALLENPSSPSENRVIGLEKTLKDLPECMLRFSLSMRALYGEQKISSDTDDTKDFIAVRNNTRRNAVLYTNAILPKSEEVISSIGFFLDYFELLEFEDWQDCLEDQITEIDTSVDKCKLMTQMHNGLIGNLKKDEDKAYVGIERLKLAVKQYEAEVDVFEKKAKYSKYWSIAFGGIGTVTLVAAVAAAIPTGGASLVVALPIIGAVDTVFTGAVMTKNLKKQGQYSASAIAKKENAKIAEEAINLTTTNLIPALRAFLNGLQVIEGFFISTKLDLEKMKTHGGKGSKRPYFKIMKAVAGRINDSCKIFQMMVQVMKSNMAAIETEDDDKNYVDVWIKEIMEKYNENN